MGKKLVLVIDFCVCQSSLGLILHLTQSLFKSSLLTVIESLQLGKLLLGVCINLIDGFLQLFLFVLQLVFEISDSVMQSV